MLLVTMFLAWHQFVWRPRHETEIKNLNGEAAR
jgi:hypothetical protein